jgi:tape measure domain-containing protein
MGLLNSFLIKIGADDAELRKTLTASARQLQSFGRDMSDVGQRLSLAISAPLAGIGISALKAAGNLEQTKVAFETMIGGAERASQHLNELKDFAAKTPFEFNDLTLASKRMQALGFAAHEVIPTLRNIGDASAALGMGAEGIQRVVTALGQIKAKGTVQAEEMRQLAEAGIPAWDILAKVLKTNVAGAMKQVEDRTVSAGTAIPAILAGISDRFGGLMARQAETLLGQWSNIKDKISFALQDIGTALAPSAGRVIKDVLDPMITKAREAAKAFADLPKPIQSAVIGVGAFAAAAPLAIWGLGTLANSIGAVEKAIVTLLKQVKPGASALDALGNVLGKGALAGATALAVVELVKLSAQIKSLAETIVPSLGPALQSAVGWLQKAASAALETAGPIGAILAALDKRGVKLDFWDFAGFTGATHNLTKELGAIESALKNVGVVGNQAAEFALEGFKRLQANIPVLAKQIQDDVAKLFKSPDTVTGALTVLKVPSAADRQKAVDDARKAYETVAKAGTQSAAVLADAAAAVRKAEVEAWGESGRIAERRAQAWADATKRYEDDAKAIEDLTRRIQDADFTIWKDTQHMAVEFGKAHDKMADAALKQIEVIVPLLQRIPAQMSLSAAKIADVDWTKSARGTALEKIFDPNSSVNLRNAVVAANAELERQNELFSQGKAGLADVASAQDRLTEAQRRAAGTTKEQRKEMGALERDVRRAFDAMTRGIARNIVEWKDWGSTLKNVAKDLASGFLEIMLKQLLQPLEKQMAKLAANLSDWLGKSLPTWLGGVGEASGKKTADAATSAIGAVPSSISSIWEKPAGLPANPAGGAAAGASQAAGAAFSSAAQWIGAISSSISAVTDIIGLFRSPLGKDTGRIEENTRGALNILGLNGDESILGATKGTWFACREIKDYLYNVQADYLRQLSDAIVWRDNKPVTNVYLDSKLIWSSLANQAKLAGV